VVKKSKVLQIFQADLKLELKPKISNNPEIHIAQLVFEKTKPIFWVSAIKFINPFS